MSASRCFIFCILIICCIRIQAQTYVSGGIYSNTTWTAANSPYIVTDFVVVFPGVTLTIEPGVTVRFDDYHYLELRPSSTLMALGTIADSIIFTSNSPAPVWGSWYSIVSDGYVFFNYCRVEYAEQGLTHLIAGSVKNSVFMNNHFGISHAEIGIDSCTFRLNGYGIGAGGITVSNCNISNNYEYGISSRNSNINNCTIDYNNHALSAIGTTTISNCEINCNRTGITADDGLIKNCRINCNNESGVDISGSSSNAWVEDCEIKYNNVGVIVGTAYPSNSVVRKCNIDGNNIGIQISDQYFTVYCNRICNSGSYGLKSLTNHNCTISDNYWCTSDSESTAAIIYDGYEDVTLGLVYFMPLDTICHLQYSISVPEEKINSFTIYPNPVSSLFTIELPEFRSTVNLEIFNVEGQPVFSSQLNSRTTQLDIQALPKGIYVVQVFDELNSLRQKLLKY